MPSFDRLFQLAKKTGDRLIVFDSHTGEGFAALPIDEYEMLIFGESDIEWHDDEDDWMNDLIGSETETILEVERDMELWRAGFDAAEAVFRAEEIEKDLVDNPPRDPFEEDLYHNPEWHSAGSVLQDRFVHDDTDLPMAPYDMNEDIFHDPSVETKVAVNERDEAIFEAEKNEVPHLAIEDLPFDPPLPPFGRKSIPHGTLEGEMNWQEEPLDDEPIFFEEPV